MGTHKIVFTPSAKSTPATLQSFVSGLQPKTYDPNSGGYRNIACTVNEPGDDGTVTMYLNDVDGREAASAWGQLKDMADPNGHRCTYGGEVKVAA